MKLCTISLFIFASNKITNIDKIIPDKNTINHLILYNYIYLNTY